MAERKISFSFPSSQRGVGNAFVPHFYRFFVTVFCVLSVKPSSCWSQGKANFTMNGGLVVVPNIHLL